MSIFNSNSSLVESLPYFYDETLGGKWISEGVTLGLPGITIKIDNPDPSYTFAQFKIDYGALLEGQGYNKLSTNDEAYANAENTVGIMFSPAATNKFGLYFTNSPSSLPAKPVDPASWQEDTPQVHETLAGFYGASVDATTLPYVYISQLKGQWEADAGKWAGSAVEITPKVTYDVTTFNNAFIQKLEADGYLVNSDNTSVHEYNKDSVKVRFTKTESIRIIFGKN